MKSLHPPLSPQHHHRRGLQSWLHTKPDMPHLLFSHHTHCSPTPSPMIMPLFPSLAPLPLSLALSLSLCLSVCLIAPSGSGTHACSCRAQQRPASQEIERAARVPGAAARLASCKVQLDSAARILPLASSAWSEAGGARQTFMHPHTLSHRTNMYSSTVTHLHTQWHVNRHSQYTPEITPNSETVKIKILIHDGFKFTFPSVLNSRGFNKESCKPGVHKQIHAIIKKQKMFCM